MDKRQGRSASGVDFRALHSACATCSCLMEPSLRSHHAAEGDLQLTCSCSLAHAFRTLRPLGQAAAPRSASKPARAVSHQPEQGASAGRVHDHAAHVRRRLVARSWRGYSARGLVALREEAVLGVEVCVKEVDASQAAHCGAPGRSGCVQLFSCTVGCSMPSKRWCLLFDVKVCTTVRVASEPLVKRQSLVWKSALKKLMRPRLLTAGHRAGQAAFSCHVRSCAHKQ